MFRRELVPLRHPVIAPPHPGCAMCLDAGWAWFLVLAAGLLLHAAMIRFLYQEKTRELQETHLVLTLHGLRVQFESELQSGTALEDIASDDVQYMLEEALAQDSAIVAVELFDVAGVSRFNTDRSLVGERVPMSWLAAIAAGSGQDQRLATWRVDVPDRAIGVAVLDASGAVAAYLTATLRRAPHAPPAVSLPQVAGIAAVFGMLAWIAVWRVLRTRQLGADRERMLRVRRRLLLTEHRLHQVLGRLGGGRRRIA